MGPFFTLWAHCRPILDSKWTLALNVKWVQNGYKMNPFFTLWAHHGPILDSKWTLALDVKCVQNGSKVTPFLTLWAYYGPIFHFVSSLWTHFEPILDSKWTLGSFWIQNGSIMSAQSENILILDSLWTLFGPILCSVLGFILSPKWVHSEHIEWKMDSFWTHFTFGARVHCESKMGP